MPKPAKTSDSQYRVEQIPLDLIDYAEQQIRTIQVDDEIHELASSIDALDLLQFPGVIAKPDGRFALAWGRRRLEAFRLRQSPTIPCRIYNGEIESIKALALVENLQRRPMSIAEECEAVRFLAEDKKLPIDTIVGQLGRTRSWVMVRLAVPNFAPLIKEALLDGNISLGAAEALALSTDESATRYIIAQIPQAKLTIAEVRAMVQSSLAMPSQAEAIEAGLAASRETHTYQPSYTACAACGQLRETGQLQFVRVCLHGCSTVTDDSTPAPHPTTGLANADPEPGSNQPALSHSVQ